MPTLGRDTCPFTGEKFARVREGRGGTFLVATPVLREEVALQLELYEDLPGHTEKERLGFRRWVADMVDDGTLPALLTEEHLLDHHEHPEPSIDVKAHRLLAWMVAERKAKYGIEKEFNFGDDRVDARHEACLVTETRQREHLIPMIEVLRDKGYVEYPDVSGQTVSSLIIRLTPAGDENADRVPTNRYASVDVTGEATLTVSASRLPPAPNIASADDRSIAAVVEVARGHLVTSRVVTRTAIATISARRPNSDEEIRRQEETVRCLEQVAQLLHQAEITLEEGRPPETAARQVGNSLLVMLQDLDNLKPGGPGLKIVNTSLGIVILCTAAVFDTLVPAPVTAGVMATGVYGSDVVRSIISDIKGFVQGSPRPVIDGRDGT